jgi:hypothetical protein
LKAGLAGCEADKLIFVLLVLKDFGGFLIANVVGVVDMSPGQLAIEVNRAVFDPRMFTGLVATVDLALGDIV